MRFPLAFFAFLTALIIQTAQASVYASGFTWHANGALARVVYGDNPSQDVIRTQGLNARRLVATIRAAKSSGPAVLDLGYSYNNRTLITAINDNVNNAWNRSFTYDGIGRLKTANAPGAWGVGAFNYDQTGNITRKQLGTRIVTLNYSSFTNRLISADDGGVVSYYHYDNRGNVINNGRDHFTYDRSEQPVIVADKGSFLYDGNKRRVRQSLNGEIIYTFYSFTGELLHRHNVTDNKRTDYLDVGGASLRISNAIATYTHKDHLGSPVAATNTSGATLWRELYSPYGEKQEDSPANRDNEGFTGHIDDTATGLTYMQARYYDPVIGRFLSNDPVGFADTLDPLMFNRYAYAGNDPVNNIDPDGRLCVPCLSGAIGGALAALSNTAAQLNSGDSFSFGELGAATVTGIAFGATGGAAGAFGGAIGLTSAAVITGTGAVTIEAINTGEFTMDTITDAIVGEVTAKGLGKAFRMLDDIPTEVTEAGLSATGSAITAISPPDDEIKIEEPEVPEEPGRENQ